MIWRYARYTVLVAYLLVLTACGSSQAPSRAEPTAGEQQTPTAGSSEQGSQPGTSGGGPASHGGPIVDQVSFIDRLRALGLNVEIVGDVQQPFLKTSGTTVRVSGGPIGEPVELQLYSYESAAQAEADAAQIGPDGSPATMMIDWLAPPHFFRAERLIVLYVGDNEQMLDLLTQVLGPQFAGR